ncbi:MAG TPA: hypothetical protein VGK68_06845 [Gaiellaceae bacterium]
MPGSGASYRPRPVRPDPSGRHGLVERTAQPARIALGCRVFGHRFRFRAEGATMTWACERGCGAGGAKEYPTAEEAARYARAFDREDRSEVGRRAPPLGMFPLRLWWTLRRREERARARRSARP